MYLLLPVIQSIVSRVCPAQIRAWSIKNAESTDSMDLYTAVNAVTALKTLGRSPDGTEELATEQVRVLV